MTRTFPWGVIMLLAAGSCFACSVSGAEPRGSSATRKAPAGQTAEAPPVRRRRGYVQRMSRNEVFELQRAQALEVVLDDATRATRLAETETWIRRIPGRFRIEGRVERMGAGGPVGGKVSGVADCAGVGEGVGVQCIFNAMWPIIDASFPSAGALMNGPIPKPSPSEALRSFRPALLVLGLDPALAEVRALLVTDDSIAHTWAGRLTANTLRANRLTGCREFPASDPPDPRCFQPLELIAEPDSDIVTIILRSAGITLRIAMRRDAEARAEKPMKVR